MASAPAAKARITSPCVNVCRMDGVTGWCEGCLRTLDEIAAWSSLDEPARRQICRTLPARRVIWRQHHSPTTP
ncbi:MAG: DUF1289 domain-containing protein [Leptothrix ochracea]